MNTLHRFIEQNIIQDPAVEQGFTSATNDFIPECGSVRKMIVGLRNYLSAFLLEEHAQQFFIAGRVNTFQLMTIVINDLIDFGCTNGNIKYNNNAKGALIWCIDEVMIKHYEENHVGGLGKKVTREHFLVSVQSFIQRGFIKAIKTRISAELEKNNTENEK